MSGQVNQCVSCGASMPEGDQVCRGCRDSDAPSLYIDKSAFLSYFPDEMTEVQQRVAVIVF